MTLAQESEVIELSRADVQFAAQLAASSLMVAGYPHDSPRGQAASAVREMLSDELLPFIVDVYVEMKRSRSKYVIAGAVPAHALMQDALQEIGS